MKNCCCRNCCWKRKKIVEEYLLFEKK